MRSSCVRAAGSRHARRKVTDAQIRALSSAGQFSKGANVEFLSRQTDTLVQAKSRRDRLTEQMHMQLAAIGTDAAGRDTKELIARQPRVAFVGRPNVGKSSLFNRVCGGGTAIVHDMPGVTRDRQVSRGELLDLEFAAVDTPGYEEVETKKNLRNATETELKRGMLRQAQRALQGADVAVLVVDGPAGVQPEDYRIAEFLHKEIEKREVAYQLLKERLGSFTEDVDSVVEAQLHEIDNRAERILKDRLAELEDEDYEHVSDRLSEKRKIMQAGGLDDESKQELLEMAHATESLLQPIEEHARMRDLQNSHMERDLMDRSSRDWKRLVRQRAKERHYSGDMRRLDAALKQYQTEQQKNVRLAADGGLLPPAKVNGIGTQVDEFEAAESSKPIVEVNIAPEFLPLRVIIVVNKCDNEDDPRCLETLEECRGLGFEDADIVECSALHNWGLTDFYHAMRRQMDSLPVLFERVHRVIDPVDFETRTGVTARQTREQLRQERLQELNEYRQQATLSESGTALAREARPDMQLAIVGRPNTGKSTLINTLLGDKHRLNVGATPGITRDSVAVPLKFEDTDITLVDTAGLTALTKGQDERRGHSKFDTLSNTRSRKSMNMANVVVLLAEIPPRAGDIDFTETDELNDDDLLEHVGDGRWSHEQRNRAHMAALDVITRFDIDIANRCVAEGRGLVIGLSKWDRVARRPRAARALLRGIRELLLQKVSGIRAVPLVPLSSHGEFNLAPLLRECVATYDSWQRRVPTRLLNKWLREVTRWQPPPSDQGKHVKLKFMVQFKSRPPTFAIKTNRTKLSTAYLRFLENQLRAEFDFGGVPIRFRVQSSAWTDDLRQSLAERAEKRQRKLYHEQQQQQQQDALDEDALELLRNNDDAMGPLTGDDAMDAAVARKLRQTMRDRGELVLDGDEDSKPRHGKRMPKGERRKRQQKRDRKAALRSLRAL